MKKIFFLLVFCTINLPSFAVSKIQKVERIMQLMDTQAQLQENLTIITQNLRPHSKIKNEAQFNEVMNQILNLDDLLNYQKKQFMTQFSDSELDDIISFYQSQGGKRLKRINPQIFSDSMQYAHQMIQKKIHLLKN